MAKKISELSDSQLNQLIENRWNQSDQVWSDVEKFYKINTSFYKNEPDWIRTLPVRRSRTRANRIFVDMEAVINSLIASPPKPNIIPGRELPESKELAITQETYFGKRYDDLNVKEVLRMGLRNLYFGRLIVLKVFWDGRLNDFNVKALDPRKVRFGKTSRNESESEFAIEEVTDNLSSLMKKFPKTAGQILSRLGLNEESLLVTNPEVTYKEAWIRDRLICKWEDIILWNNRNPYWDWDGVLATKEEIGQYEEGNLNERRDLMQGIKRDQDQRRASQIPPEVPPVGPDGVLPINLDEVEEPISYESYFFNHFDTVRKPYIFATVLNSENKPIGQTDFITQAIPLQEGIDRRKQDIDENAKLVNGKWKVDSAVMSKADAQKLGMEAGGTIYGRGVKDGVGREMGNALPQFVFDDMIDSREEIDNIMAATSAFRGEREGQETKAGRLAMIEQSFLRLNELVQVVDYVNYELFNWMYHLAKNRYTEYHYAKMFGHEKALQILEIIQDDFENGTEVKVIQGKSLPEDKQFKYQRAQEDVKAGVISTLDYAEAAGYDNPKEIVKNAMLQKADPFAFAGVEPPPPPAMPTPEDPNAGKDEDMVRQMALKEQDHGHKMEQLKAKPVPGKQS